MPSNFYEGLAKVLAEEEKGFGLFTLIVKIVFRGNTIAYRFCIALVQSIPLVVIFRRYSEDYLFSIYLYVATTCHSAWMMNGLRQFIAVTMIFAATPLMLERRYIRAILVVILAMSFHRTAIVMIPVIFIVQGGCME